MAETMTLIAGRSSKQGTSLNVGKLKEEYIQVTSTVEMNEGDMVRLGLKEGGQSPAADRDWRGGRPV